MKIVQVVRYVEADDRPATGTVALCDDGKLYKLLWQGMAGHCWKEMPVPSFPGNTLTLKRKAK